MLGTGIRSSGLWLVAVQSCCLAAVLTPLAMAVARWLSILDCPDGQRKLQRQPIPLLGGLAVYGATALTLLFTYSWTATGGHFVGRFLGPLVLSAGLICVLGAWDDIRPLRAHWKLFWQIVLILPFACFCPGIERIEIGPYIIPLGVLGPAATLCFLIGAMNAVNLLDGMDGLCSSSALIICLGAAFIGATVGPHEVVLPALALAGALAGFLLYNRPPASIYLGDCGSLSIGLLVGAFVLRGSCTSPGVFNVPVALGLFAFPLLDTTLAVCRRGLSGIHIWRPDRGHLHHRMLQRGLGVWQSLLFLGVANCALVTSAWLALVTHRDLFVAGALCAVLAAMFTSHTAVFVETLLAVRSLARIAPVARCLGRLRTFGGLAAREACDDVDLAWDHVQSELDAGNLIRVEISSGPYGRPAEQQHAWVSDTADGRSTLLVEMGQQRADGQWAHLRAIVRDHGDLTVRDWLFLLDRLAICSQSAFALLESAYAPADVPIVTFPTQPSVAATASQSKAA